MDKTCNKCYWESICKKDKSAICSEFEYECECGGLAIVTRDNKMYCNSCALELTDIEESMQTHYHLDGEYLGSDNDDIEDIILMADCGFKKIESEDK